MSFRRPRRSPPVLPPALATHALAFALAVGVGLATMASLWICFANAPTNTRPFALFVAATAWAATWLAVRAPSTGRLFARAVGLGATLGAADVAAWFAAKGVRPAILDGRAVLCVALGGVAGVCIAIVAAPLAEWLRRARVVAAYDVGSSLLTAAGAWLCLVGATAWLLLGDTTALRDAVTATVAGGALLATSLVADAWLSRWLGGVASGRDPRWRIAARPVGDRERRALASGDEAAGALLLLVEPHRTGAPFRDGGTLEAPVAAVEERHPRALRRRAVTALLVAGVTSAIALAAVDRHQGAPPLALLERAGEHGLVADTACHATGLHLWTTPIDGRLHGSDGGRHLVEGAALVPALAASIDGALSLAICVDRALAGGRGPSIDGPSVTVSTLPGVTAPTRYGDALDYWRTAFRDNALQHVAIDLSTGTATLLAEQPLPRPSCVYAPHRRHVAQ